MFSPGATCLYIPLAQVKMGPSMTTSEYCTRVETRLTKAKTIFLCQDRKGACLAFVLILSQYGNYISLIPSLVVQ